MKVLKQSRIVLLFHSLPTASLSKNLDSFLIQYFSCLFSTQNLISKGFFINLFGTDSFPKGEQ